MAIQLSIIYRLRRWSLAHLADMRVSHKLACMVENGYRTLSPRNQHRLLIHSNTVARRTTRRSTTAHHWSRLRSQVKASDPSPQQAQRGLSKPTSLAPFEIIAKLTIGLLRKLIGTTRTLSTLWKRCTQSFFRSCTSTKKLWTKMFLLTLWPVSSVGATTAGETTGVSIPIGWILIGLYILFLKFR